MYYTNKTTKHIYFFMIFELYTGVLAPGTYPIRSGPKFCSVLVPKTSKNPLRKASETTDGFRDTFWRFFGHFWLPKWSLFRSRSLTQVLFWAQFSDFLSLRVPVLFFFVPGGAPDPILVVFGSIWGRFGSIFGLFSAIFRILGRFPDGFSATFAGVRRVGVGMVPGYAVGLRYFFSGVPLGYGDLRAAI